MDIRLHNTFSGKKETFKPVQKGLVKMYNCGPTVYDTPHVGNYRTFVTNDIIRRVFEYNNYQVRQIMNITDVDDKTIDRSRKEKTSLKAITEKYENLFRDGLKSLNVIAPNKFVRATEHIKEMVELVETLIEKGVAYEAYDGVYMNISKVKDYGKLAGLNLSDTRSSERGRVANDEYEKDNPRDFVLWKFKKKEDGEISWKTPFGEGRPGWHIECSAMSMEELGSTIDIHTGGFDLIFPHHTNEIAQSESATGKRFVKYWLHVAFMTISSEKMAKSKGNIVKLEDLSEKYISTLAYRYWLLTAHYRSPIDFTYNAVKSAQNALIRLISTVSGYPEGGAIILDYRERFRDLVNDDFDMPKAVAITWNLLKDQKYSNADKRATILDFDRIFGLNIGAVKQAVEENVPNEITALAEAREDARRKKDWMKSDSLRKEIENRGFTIQDLDVGFKIRRA